MNVLLLEDEPEVGRLLLTWLNKWNINGLLAHDSREALKLLNDSPIDLLVADLILPEMKSSELIKQLRHSRQHRDLPVLMISGKAQKEDIVEAVQLGISGFIAKPFKAAEFKSKIMAIHKANRQRLNKRQVEQIWNERISYLDPVPGPLVIFGEPVNSIEELHQPANRKLASYLARTREVIAGYNAEDPALKACYIIEDDTANIMLHLKRHTSRKWVRLILLSTHCGGNPILIVRLFTINKKEDIPVFLIYDRTGDLAKNHRNDFKKLGVRVLKRESLDRERVQKLIGKYVVGMTEEKPELSQEEVLSPQEVHGRITEDLETMSSLPPLPQVYEKISALAQDPDSHLRDWIKIIKVDPMTCTTILHHANSLSYGFKNEVTEIDRAIILLGKETVEGIVASEAVRQSLACIKERGFNLVDFWVHNLAVGFAAYILSFPLDEDSPKATQNGRFASLELGDEAEKLLRQINLPRRLKLDYAKENPFVGGVMHDIGKGIMVHSYPGLFPLILAELKNKQWNAPMLAAEQEVAGGLTHTVVGEILMRKWGLGDEVCNGVRYHHQPSAGDTFTFLIGLADIIGQALYPFPREADYPLAAALEEGSLGQVSHFLPQGFGTHGLLSLEECIALVAAISPRVKYFTEKMRRSIQ